jgi:hypothetical protein
LIDGEDPGLPRKVDVHLALAIAFVVGAVRPRLSAGLARPCPVAAAALVCTAVIDLIGGQTIGADEARHLIALAGAALPCWQAQTTGQDSAVSAAVTGQPDRWGHVPASPHDEDEKAPQPSRGTAKKTVA